MKRYSINDEDYIFDSVSDVVDEMWNNSMGEALVGQKYYELEVNPLDVSTFIGVDMIIESVTDDLYEEVGERADFFAYPTDDQLFELKSLVVDWFRKNTNIETFWVGVGKAVEKVITEDDL